MAMSAMITMMVATASLATAPPATAAPNIGVRATYQCAVGKSPAHRVPVRFSGKAPRAGKAGKPIRLGRVTLTAELPVALAGEVLGPGLGRLTGTARPSVRVGQGGRSVNGQWPDLAVVPVAVPDVGKVRLTASGAVPPVIPAAPGDVTFQAGPLSLRLGPGPVGAGAPKPVGASASRVTTVSCRPETVKRLATVKVGGVAQPGTAPTAPVAADDEPRCKVPEMEFNESFESILDLTNPKYGASTSTPPGGAVRCAQVVGYAVQRKAGVSAAVVGRELLRSTAGGQVRSAEADGNWDYFGVAAASDIQPTRVTALGFGFVPTSLTLKTEHDLRIHGSARSESYAQTNPDVPWKLPLKGTTVFSRARVRVVIGDAVVNGTPLDLGPKCSSQGVVLSLVAEPWKYGMEDFLNGAIHETPKDSLLTVPRFSGCGNGENLNPLLTATAAGGGNYVRIQQGFACPADLPLDVCGEHPLTWRVNPWSPDGVFLEEMPAQVTVRNKTNGKTVVCTALSAANYAFPETKGSLVQPIGSIAMTPKVGDCRAPNGEVLTFFRQVRVSSMRAVDYDPETGVTRLGASDQVRSSQIQFPLVNPEGESTFCRFAATSPSNSRVRFNNKTQEFVLEPANMTATVFTGPGSNCDGFFATDDPLEVRISFRLPEPPGPLEISARPA